MLSPFDAVGGGPLVVGSCSWSGNNIVSHDAHDGIHVQKCCFLAKCLGSTHMGPSKAREPRPVRGHVMRRGLWDATCSQSLEKGCHAEKMAFR